MARGDHISVWRFGYTHHGIDVGDGTVIHLAGDGRGKREASVRRSSLAEFAKGSRIRVHPYGSARFDPDITVTRAESRLGAAGYHLLTNNCEHFAYWCVTGQLVSAQVGVGGSATGSIGLSSLGGAATISTVSGAGVAGLSGPGIMSGLAWIGSLIGAGAVGGLALSASLPTAASVFVTRRALRDDEFQTDAERTARKAGRAASFGAGGLAVLGSVAMVAHAGAVAGLSGPGIASGLAAIGASVGGGMAAGTVLAVALPPLIAAVLGHVVYRAVRWALTRGLPGPAAAGLAPA